MKSNSNITRNCFLTFGAMFIGTATLNGCILKSEDDNEYDDKIKIDINDKRYTELLDQGVEKIVDVPGENFKLIINYKCEQDSEEDKWTVTANKDLYMDICTLGLDENTSVYIYNIQTESVIKSALPSVNGIKQDEIDNSIKDKNKLGYNISDEITYSSVNFIEGQKTEFSKAAHEGFVNTNQGYAPSGRIKEKYFLDQGVYATEIKSIIKLRIVYPDNKERFVDVKTSVEAGVWPFYKGENPSRDTIYEYYYADENHEYINKLILTEDEYNSLLEINKSYVKAN